MSDEKQPVQDWKRLYEAALLETDPEVALGLMHQAEQAIVERALVLHREASVHNGNELKSLAYSANFLAELRRTQTHTPKGKASSA